MKIVGDAIAKPPHYASDPRKGGSLARRMISGESDHWTT